MAQVVDPPFVSANPPTTEAVAKQIVRKSIKAKQAKQAKAPSRTGAAFFNKLERDTTGLYDHLEGPVLKELNRIVEELAGARSGGGDAAKLGAASKAASDARLTLHLLIQQLGAVQNNTRHVYAGSRSDFAIPALKK